MQGKLKKDSESLLICLIRFNQSFSSSLLSFLYILHGWKYSPLGPFVPAPPEVAMQMFREHGRPPSYEGAGGGHRNGRPGPGPAPIIAPFPGFMQDPRQLRR